MKHTNSPHKYTPFEIDELCRCSTDPIYFIEKYVMIQHPTKGAVLLDLHPKQKEVVQTYHNDRNVIVGRGRQTGSSTITMSYMLWYAMFNKDQTLVTVSSAVKYAKANLDKFRFAYDNLPDWLKPKRTVNNKQSIQFDNGTRIEAKAMTSSSCKGMTVSLLHVDDPLFVSTLRQEEFWSNIYPVMSYVEKSKVLVTSLPSNEGIFGKLWHNESFTKLTLKFSDVHPDDTLSINMRSIISEKQWKREYECEFISTLTQQYSLF